MGNKHISLLWAALGCVVGLAAIGFGVFLAIVAGATMWPDSLWLLFGMDLLAGCLIGIGLSSIVEASKILLRFLS